jgi:hypothetical protein
MPDPYPHLTHLIRIPTHQEFLDQQQRRAQFEADLDWADDHGKWMLDGERWICICGCGETRERVKI